MELPRLCFVAAGSPVHPLWMIPFVLLLAAIALGPFINRHWWEKWYPAVAIGLGIVPAVYYLCFAQSAHRWIEGMEEYLGFIILLGALYIVSGGIVVRIGRKATPLANSVLLLFGGVIANIFGTTGAAMLLIRPYLRMNRGHIKPFHVVFFIFIVANAGGLLTPIGDPPLFLGYLRGVPFWWMVLNCRWAWVLVVGLLLGVFFVIDTVEHRKFEREMPEDPGAPVHILGIQNVLLIGLVIWAVFQPGFFQVLHELRHGTLRAAWSLVLSREALMLVAAFASLALTPRRLHVLNGFEYGPIREVAILFIGIFSTMAPALAWLNSNASRVPLHTPGQFYFATGSLSALLDNAPTYLTFLEVKLGDVDAAAVEQARAELERMAQVRQLDVSDHLPPRVREAIAAVVRYHGDEVLNSSISADELQVAFLLGDPRLNQFLVAISLGAVFFGACTYIGNGPNFMVKSIAEAGGVKMPGFVGYVVFYTLPVLVPIYVVVWWIFLGR